MLLCGSIFSFFVIYKAQRCHCCRPLSVCMSRCKAESCLKLFLDQFSEYRHTIPQKGNSFPILFKLCKKLLNGNRHLILHCLKSVVFKTINPCIYLVSSGIHDRTDQALCVIKIISQSFYRRHTDQWLFKGKPQPFCSSRANTKPGKRARTAGNSNSVNRIQVKLCHLCHLIQHGKQSLRMCFFIIHCIFCSQNFVFNNSYGSYDSRTVQT